MEEELSLQILNIMVSATTLARENKQTVGEKNNYYITLEQLEYILGKV